jgi:hypothetical protein
MVIAFKCIIYYDINSWSLQFTVELIKNWDRKPQKIPTGDSNTQVQSPKPYLSGFIQISTIKFRRLPGRRITGDENLYSVRKT